MLGAWLERLAGIGAGIPVDARPRRLPRAQVGMAAAGKDRDPVHEGSAIDECRRQSTRPTRVHQGIRAEGARQQPREVLQERADREPAALAALQVERHLSARGADGEGRAVGTEAEKREIARELPQSPGRTV